MDTGGKPIHQPNYKRWSTKKKLMVVVTLEDQRLAKAALRELKLKQNCIPKTPKTS
uniref:Uncharacterized protein n=1 Tax=Anopheles funestus TaxID=62324 RepID=A0A182R7V8_ANOFN